MRLITRDLVVGGKTFYGVHADFGLMGVSSRATRMIDNMLEWCDQKFGKSSKETWYVDGIYAYFANPEDRTLFVLYWSGK